MAARRKQTGAARASATGTRQGAEKQRTSRTGKSKSAEPKSVARRHGRAAGGRRARTKVEAARRLAEADRTLAATLPLRDIDVIVEDSEGAVALLQAKEPRISEVTGEPLGRAPELARVRRQNLFRAFAERHRLLGDALTVNEVAELLGVSRQTPHDRAKVRTLLAIKDNGRLVFPQWQFDPDGPDGVIAGLPEVLRELRGPLSPLARIRWFLTPKSLMEGRTPLEALRAGDVDTAVAEARTVGAS